jgi:hypothetical protein
LSGELACGMMCGRERYTVYGEEPA